MREKQEKPTLEVKINLREQQHTKEEQILLQSKIKYPRPKLKFSYYMFQEALTFYICCSFHMAKV